MIFPPAVVSAADDLLPDARRLLDDETAALYADPAVTVSCAPNCNTCCEHAIIVTAAEMRAIAAALDELPDDVRARVQRRLEDINERLTEEGLDEAVESSNFTRGFAEQYFAMHEPCPLLVDGACAVRPVRPLTCREYLVSSPARFCAEPSAEHFVRIRRRRAIEQNFGRVSTAFGEPGRRLLPRALAGEPLADPEPTRSSGPKMARILLGG